MFCGNSSHGILTATFSGVAGCDRQYIFAFGSDVIGFDVITNIFPGPEQTAEEEAKKRIHEVFNDEPPTPSGIMFV